MYMGLTSNPCTYGCDGLVGDFVRAGEIISTVNALDSEIELDTVSTGTDRSIGLRETPTAHGPTR